MVSGRLDNLQMQQLLGDPRQCFTMTAYTELEFILHREGETMADTRARLQQDQEAYNGWLLHVERLKLQEELAERAKMWDMD